MWLSLCQLTVLMPPRLLAGKTARDLVLFPLKIVDRFAAAGPLPGLEV